MTNYDYINGSFVISHNTEILFNTDGQTEIVIFNNINFLEMINSIKMEFEPNGNSKLVPEYRITYDNVNFTNWERLDQVIINQPTFNPYKKYTMYVRIKFSGTRPILLKSFIIKGRLYRAIEKGDEEFEVSGSNEVVIKPPFVYKIFKIKNVEVISSNNDNLSVFYRYSQNYGRTVTDWELLTKENITTAVINPIRFFQIEYLVKSKNGSPITIYDINLIGEMQNVTKDYYKTNLYGVRENCNCIYLGLLSNTLKDSLYHDDLGFGYDIDGNLVLNNNPNNDSTTGNIIEENYYCSNDETTSSQNNTLATLESSTNYNPYDTALELGLIEQLNHDAVLLTGHEVIYYHTDVDANGIDYTLMEYQLHHYICQGKIKVTVDDNQFPDDKVGNNNYAMDYFDTFTVEIPKSLFKQVFGLERRPNPKDVIFFCRTNRIYVVESTYAPRTFNNASIKYRLSIKKWNNTQDVTGVSELVTQEQINVLKRNSNHAELFGDFIDNDLNSVTKKDQILPLSYDNVRTDINCKIDWETINNSEIIISETHYDLGSSSNPKAVVYKPIGSEIPKSTNIAYTSWFNLVDYKTTNNVVNLFTYYDNEHDSGIKFNIVNKNRFVIYYNEQTYEAMLDAPLTLNIWYSTIINVDSRNMKITIYLYKRNIQFEDEISINSKMLKLWSTEIEMTNNDDIFVSGSYQPYIATSEAKMTNIRLFKSLIPVKQHNKILNETIIREDSSDLIIGDNANEVVNVDNYQQTTMVMRKDKNMD